MNNLILEDLIKEADKNLAESIRHRILYCKKGTLYETDSYMIYTLGVDNEDGHLNGVLCLNDNCDEEVLKEADNFFGGLNRNYVVWIRDKKDAKLEEVLVKRGIKPKRKPGSAGMIIKERIKIASLPEGFEIKEVTTRKEIDDFAIVVKEAFDKPEKVTKEMVSSDKILISPNTKAFVVYEEDKPVAGVSMVLSGETAGIYWVGTIEEKRGHGLGSYVTQVSTNAAFDNGAKVVVLQASEAGERVYKKLGYETITHYRWYPIKI